MKKPMLAAMMLIACGSLFAADEDKLGTTDAKPIPGLEGTWYCDMKNGVRSFKTFCQGRMFIIHVEPKTKKVRNTFVGLCSFKDGKLTEHGVFSSGRWTPGATSQAKVEISADGKNFRHHINGRVEAWTRCPD